MTGALRGGFGSETSTTSTAEAEVVTDDDYSNREKDQEVYAKLCGQGRPQNFGDLLHPNCRGPCNKRNCHRFPCMFCHLSEHDCPQSCGQKRRDSKQLRMRTTSNDQMSCDLQSAAKNLRELCEERNLNSDDVLEVVSRLGSKCKEMKQRKITTLYQGRKPWKWLSGRLAYLTTEEDQTLMLSAIQKEIQNIQTWESWSS